MLAKTSPGSKARLAFERYNPSERQKTMKNLILKLKALRDTRGQDLIEYALMAGFVAVAAGAIMPNISSSISTIFSQVASVMASASGS